MKKVLICVILITGLLFSGFFVKDIDVYAREANEERITELDSLEGLDPEQYDMENNRIFALGKQLRSRRQSTIRVFPDFPTLYQGNSAWKNCIMLTDKLSIGTAGCCLTGFTMIQQYYGGTDTPDLVNATMGNKACPFYYYEAAERYGYTVSSYIGKAADEAPGAYDDMVDYVWAAIWEGHPVLIGMRHDTENTHFVVAYGYAYDNIIIKDPAESKNKTYLSEYMDLGYEIHRVIIYEN